MIWDIPGQMKEKNLDQAEKLIRLAVKDEPDNESFLDSLGWVQYKRAGNFHGRRNHYRQRLRIIPSRTP